MKVHARYENDPCTNRKSHRADKLEPAVWEYVFAALQEPGQRRADLDAYIELERSATRGNPHEEARVWAGRLAEIGEKRARYQEMTASGLITFDELRDRLSGLEEARRTAERELGALRERRERVEELERARDGLLDSLEAMAPEVLGCLNPEERRHFYGLLPLRVLVHPDGTPEVLLSAPAAGVEAGTNVCVGATLPSWTTSAHKGDRVRELLLEERGRCDLLFLPPYSLPDLSPIEEAFSKLKALLRKAAAHTRGALVEAIGRALDAVTVEDARGRFGHCGYPLGAKPS
jgi:hypothetical protein